MCEGGVIGSPQGDPSGGGAAGLTTRGRETASRLRRAAREVFAEIGYVNARVEDIVTRADVSHGTFYTYYENKAAVLSDLVADAAVRVREIAEAPWDGEVGEGAAGVRRVLEDVLGRFLTTFAEDADVVRTWVEAAAVDPEFAARLTDIRNDFVDRVAANVELAIGGRAYDARTGASALVAMVEGWAIEHGSGLAPGQPVPHEAVATLAALWHGGLAALSEPASEGGSA